MYSGILIPFPPKLVSEPETLSQYDLKAKFFGLGLVVSGLGLILGLVKRWPHSHLGWPCGLVVNHQNLVMNESQSSVTEYLSASSSEYSHSCQ